MPTYQYVCTECGEPLEAVQSFSDDALTTCPVCGGQLRKVFSAVGVVFKGSGFYRNDSRTTAGSKSSSSTDGSSSGDSSGSDSSKTESGKTDKKSADPKTSGSDASSTPAKPAAAAAKPSGTGSAA